MLWSLLLRLSHEVSTYIQILGSGAVLGPMDLHAERTVRGSDAGWGRGPSTIPLEHTGPEN